MVCPSPVMLVFWLTVVPWGRGQVYAGVFPLNSSDFPKLEESINRVSYTKIVIDGADSTIKLTLTDRSVTIQRESSSALGQGCRLGFLGSLHMSVFCQRLEDEYDANVIVTAPTVPYKGARVWSPLMHLLRLSSVVYHDRTTKFVRSGVHL